MPAASACQKGPVLSPRKYECEYHVDNLTTAPQVALRRPAPAPHSKCLRFCTRANSLQSVWNVRSLVSVVG
jgi:hypothetical protein